jgi:hypothetical protein
MCQFTYAPVFNVSIDGAFILPYHGAPPSSFGVKSFPL